MADFNHQSPFNPVTAILPTGMNLQIASSMTRGLFEDAPNLRRYGRAKLGPSSKIGAIFEGGQGIFEAARLRRAPAKARRHYRAERQNRLDRNTAPTPLASANSPHFLRNEAEIVRLRSPS
jgi:hypothetical protein